MFGLTRPYIPIPYRQVSAHVVTHRAALQAAKEKAAERVEVRMIVFLHIQHLFLLSVDPLPLHDPCIVSLPTFSLPSLIPTTIITCNKQTGPPSLRHCGPSPQHLPRPRDGGQPPGRLHGREPLFRAKGER